MSAVSQTVGALADLVPGTARKVEVAGISVSLVRIDDDVYAIGDRCSHANVSLSDGEVDEGDCTLECPKHGSTFDLRTAPGSGTVVRVGLPLEVVGTGDE